MNCQNCGAAVIGDFCANCGARVDKSLNEPAIATATAKPKSMVKLFAIVGLSIVLLGAGVFGIGQQGQIATLTNSEAAANKKIKDFEISVTSWRGLLAEAKSSKDTCYYNYWCSASTYRGWINLVNLNQEYLDDAEASVNEWRSKAIVARNARLDVENRRTMSFVGAGISAVALLVVVFVGRRKPQKVI